MNKYIRLKSFRKIAFTAVLFTGLLSASHSTQANEIDQNDGTALKQASRLSQEIAGSSLFDLINIMPPELQSGLASQMPLPELLKLNRTADDVPKGTLKVGPVLVDIIPAQFHQAIERLFTITQNEGGSLNFTANTDLDDDIVAIQAEHLMQVLRALYDHQYYKINDDVYNQVISRFQNHYLWKNGDLETFYWNDDDPDTGEFSKLKNSDLVDVLVGQSISLIRSGRDQFSMGEIDDISDRIMNIKAELMFHANNSNIKESKLQLINLIVEKRAQLTKETVNRIHSSKDEPGIYHSSAGAIDYALENPGKNIIWELI